MPLTAEQLAKERRWIEREKAGKITPFFERQKPWEREVAEPFPTAKVPTGPGEFAEREEAVEQPTVRTRVFLEERKPGTVPLITTTKPVEPWRYRPVGDDICAEREEDVVQLNPDTAKFNRTKQKWEGKGMRILETRLAQECVYVGDTKRCADEFRDRETCDRVKFALACSKDDTGGQLTKTMISEVADVSPEDATRCVAQLRNKGLVMSADEIGKTRTHILESGRRIYLRKGEIPTFPKDLGEAYYIMGREKAEEVLEED